MTKQIVALIAASLLIAACGKQDEAAATGAAKTAPPKPAPAAPPPHQRGGSVRVGDHTWTIVPSMQCGVYPGGVVAISGHAESDPDIEIVIDVDPNGPSGVRVGGENPETSKVSWHAVRETLKVEIDGKLVRGMAIFSAWPSGAGASAPGEFEVDCS